MSVGDTFGWYTYTGDDGQDYNVRLSDAIAAAGVFAIGSSPLGSGVRAWPYHYRDMRHVTGHQTSDTAKHGSCPIGSPNDARLSIGGTWAAHGLSYTILGVEGERRPASHLR